MARSTGATPPGWYASEVCISLTLTPPIPRSPPPSTDSYFRWTGEVNRCAMPDHPFSATRGSHVPQYSRSPLRQGPVRPHELGPFPDLPDGRHAVGADHGSGQPIDRRRSSTSGADNFAFGEPADGPVALVRRIHRHRTTARRSGRDGRLSTRPRSSASRRPDQQRQQGGGRLRVRSRRRFLRRPVPLDAGSAAVDADPAKTTAGTPVAESPSVPRRSRSPHSSTTPSTAISPWCGSTTGCGRNCRPRAAATAPSSRCARRAGSTPTVLPPRPARRSPTRRVRSTRSAPTRPSGARCSSCRRCS